MITFYELSRLVFEPFMPAILYYSRHDLKYLLRNEKNKKFQLLDVGGRKTPYTIGLPIEVTIIDLPRRNNVQNELNLGISKTILANLQKKRSNIKSVVIGDMLKNKFSESCFDGVVSIEVIEHIEQDSLFINQISRVLKSGGWFYLSTPNGDYIKNTPPNYNPDHKRHYTKEELSHLLSTYFEHVEVWYGVKTGKKRWQGLRSFSLKHPLRTINSMFSNLISIIESRNLAGQSRRTAHLFALAWKPCTEE